MDVLRRGLAFTDGPNGASLPLEALMDDVAEATDGRITRDVGRPALVPSVFHLRADALAHGRERVGGLELHPRAPERQQGSAS